VTKRLRFRWIALFYFSIAVTLPAHAQRQAPFRLVQDTFAVVSLQINGLGPFDFILDTGTDTTIVDPALYSQLSLVPVDRTVLTTPAGKRVLLRSSLGTVSLGPVSVSDIEALVQDMPALRRLDPRIRGILGQNFLSQFNYVLDYHRRFVRFESRNELRDSSSGVRVPMEAMGGRMVIQTGMPSLGIAKAHLLLDSGASDLVLFRTINQMRPVSRSWGFSIVNSRNDSRAGTMVRVNDFAISDQHFHDLRVALLPPGADESRPEDGLLPTVLFHALYVNNRERFVILNPKFQAGE
jgi:hypothetical protein